jgi:hypothetical protein
MKVASAVFFCGLLPGLPASAAAAFPQAAPSPIKSYTGALVEADCNPASKSTVCQVSSTTVRFGILLGDKVYAFDAAGNTMAHKELKAAGKAGRLSVTVNGQVKGNILQVDSLQIY